MTVFFREDLPQLTEDNDILWTRIHRGFHETLQLTKWCANHDIITEKHITFMRNILDEKLEQCARKKHNREANHEMGEPQRKGIHERDVLVIVDDVEPK